MLGYLLHAPGIFLCEHCTPGSASCPRGVGPGDSFLLEEASRSRLGPGAKHRLAQVVVMPCCSSREGWWVVFSVPLGERCCEEMAVGAYRFPSQVKGNRLQSDILQSFKVRRLHPSQSRLLG